MLCPSCGRENAEGSAFCNACGLRLKTESGLSSERVSGRELPGKPTIFGIAAITLVAVGLFLPAVFLALFVPIAIVLATLELFRGNKALGGISVGLGVLQLLFVASTFQSCARELEGVRDGSTRKDRTGSGSQAQESPDYAGRAKKRKPLPWEGNLRVASPRLKSIYAHEYNDTWEGEVENVGSKLIKEAKIYVEIYDSSGGKVDEKWDFILGHMRPGEKKTVQVFFGRLSIRPRLEGLKYRFVIEDHE